MTDVHNISQQSSLSNHNNSTPQAFHMATNGTKQESAASIGEDCRRGSVHHQSVDTVPHDSQNGKLGHGDEEEMVEVSKTTIKSGSMISAAELSDKNSPIESANNKYSTSPSQHASAAVVVEEGSSRSSSQDVDKPLSSADSASNITRTPPSAACVSPSAAEAMEPPRYDSVVVEEKKLLALLASATRDVESTAQAIERAAAGAVDVNVAAPARLVDRCDFELETFECDLRRSIKASKQTDDDDGLFEKMQSSQQSVVSNGMPQNEHMITSQCGGGIAGNSLQKEDSRTDRPETKESEKVEVMPLASQKDLVAMDETSSTTVVGDTYVLLARSKCKHDDGHEAGSIMEEDDDDNSVAKLPSKSVELKMEKTGSKIEEAHESGVIITSDSKEISKNLEAGHGKNVISTESPLQDLNTAKQLPTKAAELTMMDEGSEPPEVKQLGIADKERDSAVSIEPPKDSILTDDHIIEKLPVKSALPDVAAAKDLPLKTVESTVMDRESSKPQEPVQTVAVSESSEPISKRPKDTVVNEESRRVSPKKDDSLTVSSEQVKVVSPERDTSLELQGTLKLDSKSGSILKETVDDKHGDRQIDKPVVERSDVAEKSQVEQFPSPTPSLDSGSAKSVMDGNRKSSVKEADNRSEMVAVDVKDNVKDVKTIIVDKEIVPVEKSKTPDVVKGIETEKEGIAVDNASLESVKNIHNESGVDNQGKKLGIVDSRAEGLKEEEKEPKTNVNEEFSFQKSKATVQKELDVAGDVIDAIRLDSSRKDDHARAEKEINVVDDMEKSLKELGSVVSAVNTIPDVVKEFEEVAVDTKPVVQQEPEGKQPVDIKLDDKPDLAGKPLAKDSRDKPMKMSTTTTKSREQHSVADEEEVIVSSSEQTIPEHSVDVPADRSPSNKDGDHDSGVDESTQGKEESPKKSAAAIPQDNGKSVTDGVKQKLAASPAKKKVISPSQAVASPARTSKTLSSTSSKASSSVTPQPVVEKKLPMNKIVVGTTASPNLKVVKSKIGSMANIKHKPGGGEVKMETKKIDLSTVKSKVGSTDNIQYRPLGGEKKVLSRKLEWKAESRIGSLDNAAHKAGGGTKKIETLKLEFKEKAKPKVGSKDNIQYKPGGGAVQIEEHKLMFKEAAKPKIGSMDNVGHKPGGGAVQIFDEKTYYKQQSSLTGSEGHLSDGQLSHSPQPSPNAVSPAPFAGDVTSEARSATSNGLDHPEDGAASVHVNH